MNQKIKQWLELFQERLGADRALHHEPLARYCNWRIGGQADILVTARTQDELSRVIHLAIQNQIPYTLIGFGANVLVSDKGIRGLVVINRAQQVKFLSNAVVETDSGTNLAVLAKACAQNGVGGLEFLIGIPGTVGAAIAVNAGTRNEWIGDIVKEVRTLSNSGVDIWHSGTELSFSYRHSSLKETGAIVLAARLQGRCSEAEKIEENIAVQLQVRKTQPTGPSAGSVFKNPQGDYAGRLIQACGLKGRQIGGAQISPMHANFIINVDAATANDVKILIELIKNTVYDKFGIKLEEEIRYLGEW